MPWRHLIRFFTNNPHLMQQLSETKPIRAAARLTVYWYNEARHKGKDALENFKSERPNTSDGQGFLARFKQELQTEMKKAEELNKQNRTQSSTEGKNMNEFKTRPKQRWEEPSDQQKRKGRP